MDEYKEAHQKLEQSLDDLIDASVAIDEAICKIMVYEEWNHSGVEDYDALCDSDLLRPLQVINDQLTNMWRSVRMLVLVGEK